MGPLSHHTIDSIRAGLLAKEFSAEELTRAALAFAEAENPKTNAYLTCAPERAPGRCPRGGRSAGRRERSHGALAGVPIAAVKDA